MNFRHLLGVSLAALVVLGLVFAAATTDLPAAPPKPHAKHHAKPHAKPHATFHKGPQLGPIGKPHPGPIGKPHPGPIVKPHPGPIGKPHPGPIVKPHPGPIVKPHLKVHPGPHPKVHVGSTPKVHVGVVHHPVPRPVIPRYLPRVLVRYVAPPVVVTTFRDLAVVPVKQFTEAEAYRVIDVDDDYILTVLIDGQPTPVRMVGVEPPLVAAVEGQSGALPEIARHFVRNLLVGEFVYLDYDPGLAPTDEEGRLVAYVHRAPDGLLANLELIRQGYALVAEGYSFEYRDAFASYQGKAQADRKGIWGTLPAVSE